MIATIVQHSHTGHGDDGDEEDAAEAIAALDSSRDGKISESEIKEKVKFVALRADMLYERVVLEQELLGAVVKLANFLVYTILFITALGIVAPADKTAEVHTFLHQHFMLGKVSGIKDIHSIYKFLEDFEHQNELVQATSANYWCENRYFDLKWDYHAETPSRKCASPRMYTLYGASKGVPWGSDGEASGGHGSSSGGHGSSSGGGHRRMSSIANQSVVSDRRLAGAAATSDGPCADDNEQLSYMMHTQGKVTCADVASTVCKEDVGLILCRKTCGYCAPFQYERLHAFPYPVVSTLPAMVYQERFNTKPCHGYAESYLHQKSNQALIILPTLDGTRDDDLITCVDRSSEYSEEWAHKMACPMCEDGWHRDTKVHQFHGAPVYPKFLVEAHKDIEIMEGIGWIDIQTKDVVLSTSLYAQGSELFTFISVTFDFDEAGGISGSYRLTTIKDLVGDEKLRFMIYMFLAAASVSFALVRSSASLVMKRKHEGKSWSDLAGAVFEVCSQLTLISFIAAMLIGWTQQKLVSDEYDEMLQSFLELKELSYEAFEEVIDHFFEVKTHVYHTTGWYARHRIAAYGVIYVQFVQLIMYFNVHPRMALLTRTIMTGLDHMVHFLLLFAILFTFLAFMAHWMFGPDLNIFQTFAQTISEQIRMLFGEFLVAGEGMRSLTGTIFGIYILYFITFMFIVSWTLLNFFLAIVVDAFVIVKEDLSGADIHNNFFVDVFDAIKTPGYLSKQKWPDHQALQAALTKVQKFTKDGTRMTSKENNVVSNETGDEDESEPILFWRDVRGMFDSSTVIGQRNGAIDFVCYYGAKCNAILRVKNLKSTKEVREADAIDQVLGGVKGIADKVGLTALADKVGATDLANKAKDGIMAVADKLDPDKVGAPSGEGEEEEKETDAPSEAELTDKEQALFVAGMKTLSKLVMKMEPLPDSSNENEWATVLTSLGVSVCRELQHCNVFKEDDELSV